MNILKKSGSQFYGQELLIAEPNDGHGHLRRRPFMDWIMGPSARRFRYQVAMPNTSPPITTDELLREYEAEIRACVRECVPDANPEFTPVMALYLTPDTPPDMIRKAKLAGAKLVKWYTKSAKGSGHNTTGADLAVPISCFESGKMDDVVRACFEARLPISVHGEDPDVADQLLREEAFIVRFAAIESWIRQHVLPAMPHDGWTPWILEHISTKSGALYVCDHPHVRMSVTPHHLLATDKMAEGNPFLHCMPCLKTEEDVRFLCELIRRDFRRAHLGTDTAPHSVAKKLTVKPAGIFNAEGSLEALVETMDMPLDVMDRFFSYNMTDAYGLPRNTRRLRLVREPWTVETKTDPEDAQNFLAGETLDWQIRGIAA